MADDQELRARIEAQVAARRAAERSGADRDGVAGAGPEQPVRTEATGAEVADVRPEVPRDRFAALHAAATAQAATAAARGTASPSGTSRDAAGRPADAEEPRPRPTSASPRPRPRPASPGGSPSAHPPARRRSLRPRPPAQPEGSASAEPAAADTASPADSAAPEDAAPSEDAAPPADRRRAVQRRLLRIGVLMAIAVGAIVLLRVFVVSPYYIPSGSMEPTLHGCHGCDNDRVLVDKISYRFHAPHQTDIVVFNRPPRAETTDKVLVKRVIGLPGDHIALRGGRVWLNGKPLREPYVHAGCRTQPITGTSRWTVPQGDVFVMGDNRCTSLDSRQFGPITDSSIIGRAFVIVWPFGHIGLL